MNIKISENEKPSFLITIDTEGDNLWSKSTNITTKNANYLSRFQSLCEKYGFKPTYLANYEMAKSKIFQNFGKKIIKKQTGEIGMHLHAWNSPPIIKLTDNDFFYQPFLIDYPKEIMYRKVEYLTDLLKKTFNIEIYSHRAGKWGFNEEYAQILIEMGYCVDCSVTPNIFWTRPIGIPYERKKINYKNYPNESYFINPYCIKKKGNSSLLEIPVTIIEKNKVLHRIKYSFISFPLIYKFLDKYFHTTAWFRPNSTNQKLMLKILITILHEKKDYIEFVIHSSELMPGGSLTFKSQKEIESLYESLEFVFEKARKFFVGRTLKEYYDIKNINV